MGTLTDCLAAAGKNLPPAYQSHIVSLTAANEAKGMGPKDAAIAAAKATLAEAEVELDGMVKQLSLEPTTTPAATPAAAAVNQDADAGQKLKNGDIVEVREPSDTKGKPDKVYKVEVIGRPSADGKYFDARPLDGEREYRYSIDAINKPKPTPAAPAEAKPQPVREAAAEFDKVLENAAIELGWVEDIDALTTPKMPKGAKQDAISISAKIARSKETAKMRNHALDLMGESKTKAMTPTRKAELLPKLKALVERERASNSMLTITEPDERRPLGVPANELAVGDELGMPDGKSAKVTDIDPDTGDVGITSADGIIVNVPEGSTVYVVSRKAAEQSAEFAPAGEAVPTPKLAAGVKQGDLIDSTQSEDFALVGEEGTDAAKAQSEKEAAAKAKAEARALQEKQQLGLFSPQEMPKGALFQGVRPGNLGVEHGKSSYLTDDLQLAVLFSKRTGEPGVGRIDVYDPAHLPPLEDMLEASKSKPGSRVYSFVGLGNVAPVGTMVQSGGRWVFEPAKAKEEKQQLGLFSPQEQAAQAKADASTKRQADALKAEQQSNLQQKGQAALNFLDKLEKDINGAMFSDPLFLTPLAKLAIKFAKALVRGGMALEQAIRQAIQQAREELPNDPVKDDELAKAMTGSIAWLEPVEPSPAMQEDRKFSEGMFTGTYVAESDEGWHERAVKWVDQFGGDLMLALQKTSRPDTMSGMTDALKEYALQEIMSRANDVLKAKQSAESMLVAGEVMDQAAEDLKAIGAESGQALAARRLSQQRYSFLYPVLSLRGLIKRMHKRIPFPEVGDDAIRKWVMAARQRAVQELLKDTSKADAIVAREFKREARDLGVVWGQVMRSALLNQKQVKRSIMQAIVRHPQLRGLSPDAVAELANMLGKQWQQKRNEAMHAELAKFIDMPRVKPKVRKLLMDEVPRIIQWANLGVLTNSAFRDAIAPLFGMEQLNGSMMQRVVDMSQEAQRVGGSNRDRMIEQIYHLIQRSGKIRWQDIARDYWYASVLSGVMTQVDNAMGIINGGLNIAMMAGLSGRNAAGVIRAGARGAKQAVVDDFFKILWRGDLWRAASFNRERPENALEGLAESRNLFLRVLSAGKFVRRLQNALDHVTGLATEQAALAHVLYREGRDADLQRMLEPTANDISQARAIAEAEGTPADSMQRRIREILQQEIPDELVLESKDIRRLVTFQNSPHGVLGSVYHGLNAAEKHFPLIKFLSGTNFARFASNYGNELLNYNPVVAAARWVLSDPRRFGAYRGGKPMWGVFRIPEINQTERSLIAVKGMVGAAIATAAAALFLGDDDKGEQDIDITGSFKSLNPQQKNQLLAQGKKPYSIKFGDTYISYRQLGFGGVMTVIGEIRDRQLYDPKFSKESAVSKWTDAGLSGLLVVRDSSAIAALMETVGFLNAYKYDTSQLKEKAGPKYLSRLMGSAIPTILKDVDAWADPQMFKANSGWEYFLQTVPYLRREVNGGLPMVNILGDPISVERYPWSRWVKQRTNDPEFKTLALLAERGVFMPTPAATAVTMPNGKRRELTAKERYEYAVETGKLYRQFIRRDGRKFLAMDPDMAADAISNAAAKARRDALGKVTKAGARTQREAE